MSHDITAALDRLLAGNGWTREDVLWTLLIVSGVFTTAYLVTMLVTRWGDRSATSKSLIFSLIVHAWCFFGLWELAQRTVPPIPAPPPEVPLRIQQIVESNAEMQATDAGNTPVWERLPTEKIEVARVDRTLPQFTPLEAPDRQTEPLMRPEMDIPDLPHRPDEPAAAPQVEQRAEPSMRREIAAVPLNIESPQAEARPEVETPLASTVRPEIARSDRPEIQIEREPTRGAVDRIADVPDPARQLSTLDVPPDPAGMLQRGPESEVIVRRTGPIPALQPDPEAGTAGDEQENAASSSPAALSLSRTRTRVPMSRDDGALERLRTERTPQSTAQPNENALALRDSIPLPFPQAGPAVPNVERPSFPAVRDRKSASVPSTYQLRNLDRRREAARKFGGTDQSERAVELSLRWLAVNQTAEGYWDADRHGAGQVKIDEQGVDRYYAGRNADSGLTALAVLAFLGAGYTHEEGQYATTVDRALRWLVSKQTADGYLGGEATHYEKMYCHGIVTYALAEAYGMQSDPALDNGVREAVEGGVAYILENQNSTDGGWRYQKGQEGDMSMFGWQLMALKSAEIAGLPIPAEARARMVAFLKERSLGQHNGLAGYVTDRPATPAMTAEALFCKQMLGITRTNPSSVEAADFLLKHLPKRSELNLYYWYYGTLAMYQYGGRDWETWNDSVRDLLIAEQITTGPQAGSWEPRGPWGRYGGRVFSTALSTLCLEVYYRFLPLYQLGGEYNE